MILGSQIVGSHSAWGFSIVMFSGALIASFAAPMKLSREWSWENTWFVYATLALLLLPLALVAWAIPHPIAFYAAIPLRMLLPPLLLGFGWGIAQVTFGISIARVGMAMAFAIVIGLSSLLGSIIPLAVLHPEDLASRPGALLLASAVLLLCGLVLYALADRERESNARDAASSRNTSIKGVLLCVFTGCLGPMINLGFVFGSSIAQEAVHQGIRAERATLSVWAVVLAAGYLPNLGYTLLLLKKNHSAQLFRKSFPREFLLALAAACLWLFGMLGYGVGANVMGKYGNSIGFAVCMAVVLLWSSALGLIAREWKSASSVAHMRMRMGLAFIIVSISVLGVSSLLRQ
jgi:L-rhamnose-H+ transport protein